MVAAFDYCLHGKGGAAPSIDTAMHGLVDAPHVDHLHPDSGIALATAADGEELTEECFGDRVVWVPWRRPGFQLGLDIAAVQAGQPAGHRRDPRRARHHRVGRDQRGGRGATRWRSSAPRRRSSTSAARPSRSAPVVPGNEPLPEAERRAKAAAHLPDGPRAGLHRPAAGRALHRQRRRCWTSSPARSSRRWPRWARPARTTSCAPRSGRWCSTCRRRRRVEEIVARLQRAARRPTARTTAAYYERHATPDSPPMRGADPAIVLVPGVGMFSFGAEQADRPGGRRVLRQRDQRDARRRVGVDATRRSTRRRSSASSTGPWRRPSSRRMPAAQAAGHPGRARHRRRRRASARPSRSRLAAEGACVVVADLDAAKAAAGGRRDRRRRTSRSR